MADKRRILLVDDEPGIVMVTKKQLEIAGYEVIVAMDGQQALDKAKAAAHDLMILDVMLPKVGGFEVCAALKSDPALKQIPIIIFSARAQEVDRQTGAESGADAYVPKPYTGSELLSQIERLLKAQP